MVYVDDILIASRMFSEHVEHLEYVLNKLQNGGLTGEELGSRMGDCRIGRRRDFYKQKYIFWVLLLHRRGF